MANTTLDGSASPFVVSAGSTVQANTGDVLALLGGGATRHNSGLMAATGAGGLTISSATLQNTAGTLLASGSGDLVTLQDVDLIGGQLAMSGGGAIRFAGTLDTLDLGSATGTIPSGGTLQIWSSSMATLDVFAATIDNRGDVVIGNGFGAEMAVTSPRLTLTGGCAAVSLSGETRLDVTVALAQRYWLPPSAGSAINRTQRRTTLA